jgi:hypothetical protein
VAAGQQLRARVLLHERERLTNGAGAVIVE